MLLRQQTSDVRETHRAGCGQRARIDVINNVAQRIAGIVDAHVGRVLLEYVLFVRYVYEVVVYARQEAADGLAEGNKSSQETTRNGLDSRTIQLRAHRQVI